MVRISDCRFLEKSSMINEILVLDLTASGPVKRICLFPSLLFFCFKHRSQNESLPATHFPRAYLPIPTHPPEGPEHRSFAKLRAAGSGAHPTRTKPEPLVAVSFPCPPGGDRGVLRRLLGILHLLDIRRRDLRLRGGPGLLPPRRNDQPHPARAGAEPEPQAPRLLRPAARRRFAETRSAC